MFSNHNGMKSEISNKKSQEIQENVEIKKKKLNNQWIKKKIKE